MQPAGSDEQGATRPRGVLRRVVGGLVSIGLIVAIFAFLIPQLTSVDLSAALAELTVASVVVCLALGVLHLVANWSAIVVSLPGVRLRQAGVANLSGAAVSNSLPEGGAVGTGLTYAIFHSWGFGVDAVTASLTATGAWSQMVRYSLLSVGLLTLTFGSAHETQWVGLSVLVAAVVAGGTVLFVRVVDSERVARAVGHLADRVVGAVARLVRRSGPDLTAWVLSLRTQLADVVANRRGRMTLATLGGELSAVLVLVAALRLMGIGSDEVGWPLAIVAYGAMSFASMVLPTPGGVGVAEASLFAVLGPSVPSSQDNSLAAAIALYRMATWLLPTVSGIPAYVFWRYRSSWRAPTGEPVVEGRAPGSGS